MAVNKHITLIQLNPLHTKTQNPFQLHDPIIELNAHHTKRQNLFQELDAVIHLLMEAKHWGLRKSRNATSLNSRFKSLDTLKVKIISVTFRRVIRTNHKKDRKSGSAGMPRPISYAVFCLKKEKYIKVSAIPSTVTANISNC